MRIVTDLFAWAGSEVPKWNVISISGYHMREAGATAVQEVAFTLANAIAYIEAALRAGLEIDKCAPRLSFFFSCDRNFLEEIAKFRAARRLYAHLMRERFGARDPRSMKMRFHAQTAGSSLTAQQPYVNVVRTTYEALAAVLGGAQSLHTNGFDEALALPTEESAGLALRTQQVIAHESGITSTADPVGGSYCIESLTDEIEDGARQYLTRIEALGGTVAAIEQGFIQREIQSSAYEFQKRVESGEQKLVGVNAFRSAEERPVPLLRIDAEAEKSRCEEVREFRQSRREASVQQALKRLEDAAASADNLMPAVLNAVEHCATVGEISETLRGVYGTYNENVVC
jgi:methylmalonyl-CoA mutase N-terminal domain/subunit